jgi:hypothetical protein
MHTENLLVDDGGNGKAVKAIGESFPKFYIVSSLTFVIESVDSVDGGTFVVSSENEEVLRVLDLVSQEQAYRLQALLSSINIVSQKEIVGIRWETSVLKQSQQIVVLPMDITTNLNWGF